MPPSAACACGAEGGRVMRGEVWWGGNGRWRGERAAKGTGDVWSLARSGAC
jgi:hypothetical protein